MGSAVGAAYAAGGARVLTSVAGRSARTRRLAALAGLELVEGLDELVRLADVVVSIVPPGEALAVADDVGAAARRVDADPLVADLNAIAPATARELELRLAGSGLDVVDGSISGGPPHAGGSTRVYLSGARAAEVAVLDARGIDARVVGSDVGLASAVKMSTASVYKGTSALLAHALVAASANGVLDEVLDDLRGSFPQLVDGAGPSLARAAAKAHRYVAEMQEIATAQQEVGLTRDLFDGFSAAYGALARSPLGGDPPESVRSDVALEDVLERLLAAPFPPRGAG